MKSSGEQIGIKLSHDKYVHGVREIQREIVIGEFGQVSDMWKNTPGEVTRLLRFSRNIRHNSVNIKRNTLIGKQKNINKSPVVERSIVCLKN